jgi:hypothetical protein
MDLLVSSDQTRPAAGRSVASLCSAGAEVGGPDETGSPLGTAVSFATLDCVDALIAIEAGTNTGGFVAAVSLASVAQSPILKYF